MFVVTGANGFIARHVVRHLIEGGHRVLAYSRSRPPSLAATAVAHHIDDYAQLPATPNAVLIHLAEPARLLEADGATALARCRSTQQLLLRRGFGHIVYASSAVVYGSDHSRPSRIEDATSGAGRYAELKLAGERATTAVSGTVLRLANTIGPGMASDNIISDVLRQLGLTAPLRVRTLAPVRDFIDVADVAQAICSAALKRSPGTFNVGTGRATSVRELVAAILELAGQPGRDIVETGPAPELPSYLVLDPSRTYATFGWQAERGLTATLQSLITSELSSCEQ